MIKKTFLLLLFSLIAINLCFANTDNKSNDKAYVKSIIKEKTDKALQLINNDNLTEQEKKDKIFQIIGPSFDFNIMSKLVLGKKYWSKLSKEEKERFIKLFEKKIKIVYLDRVSISGKLNVKYKEPVQKNKKIIYIPATFTIKDKNYSVLFKVWKSKKGWKIYDIEVEGISIIRTYKSQFHDILSKGSMDSLFKKLESSN
jgi:phospholipid transport system substrate-binding protein